MLSDAVDKITNGSKNNVIPVQIVKEEVAVGSGPVLESIPTGFSHNATTTKPIIESVERSLSQQEFHPPYAQSSEERNSSPEDKKSLLVKRQSTATTIKAKA